MNVAQHAEQILAAWRRADATRFEMELERALRSCQRAPSPLAGLEGERREVLAGVVESLRTLRPCVPAPGRSRAAACTPEGMHAGFALLEHLRQRAAA